jgi:hypothetical protein
LKYDTFKEQEMLLNEGLSSSLSPTTSLSASQKQILIIEIIKDISTLEILLTPEEI